MSERAVEPSDDRTTSLLDAAVEALGGVRRDGQVAMAQAVAEAVTRRRHLLVQAGTGTGKSLGYLVPVVDHAVRTDKRVVVSTATLALQRQVVGRDLPLVVDALAPHLPRRPAVALLKGWHNYLCVHKVAGGYPDDGTLFEHLAEPMGPRQVDSLGAQVVRVREWAEETDSGDRDDLVPGVSDRAWRQVSVTSLECLGRRCPMLGDCFGDAARAAARAADVVVTNHAMLAATASHGSQALPEHDVLVVDEAHELADRVTAQATGELSLATVEHAARSARRLAGLPTTDLDAAGQALAAALVASREGRFPGGLPDDLAEPVAVVRDTVRGLLTALRTAAPANPGEPDGGRQVATAALSELFEVAERLVAADERTVLWCARGTDRRGSQLTRLHVAPLSVSGLIRNQLLTDRVAVLTSATLSLGGSFDAAARSVGLAQDDAVPGAGAVPPSGATANRPGSDRPRGDRQPADGSGLRSVVGRGDGDGNGQPADDRHAPQETESQGAEQHEGSARQGSDRQRGDWLGIDVGSPFDYARQGICYVAAALPAPGRDPATDAQLDEIEALVRAAGGRTLGLFSSRRAAQAAAEAMRERLDVPVLAQGDDQLPTLVAQFADDPATCLFGTLSLWQGVDVPGPTCRLVLIDRIPFPRPDDPVSAARSEAVAKAGGNGFMAVAASHAALLLAQGAGRLIRTADDRGVVAVLDPRLATARYGTYLTRSLPPFWRTTDRDVVLAALARLRAADGGLADP